MKPIIIICLLFLAFALLWHGICRKSDQEAKNTRQAYIGGQLDLAQGLIDMRDK